MVENFDNHKKVDEQNRKIVLQLEAATSLYQMPASNSPTNLI